MNLIRFPLIIGVIVLIACNVDKVKKQSIKRIIIDDVIAEGNISSDSTLNGLIKFYDTTTNKLVIEATYKDGKVDGYRKDYYLNGKTKGIGPYENGKRNGTFSTYDSSGQITSKQDFYYDLVAGNNLAYEKWCTHKLLLHLF